MRLKQVRLRLSAVASLIEQLAEFLVTGSERAVVVSEGALSQLEQGFRNSNRFRKLSSGPERLKFVVQDAPEFFFALHLTNLRSAASPDGWPALRLRVATPAVHR